MDTAATAVDAGTDSAEPTELASGCPARGTSWSGAFRASWPAWAVAHFCTLLALAIAKYEVTHFRISSTQATSAAHSGLLGFDAAWYRLIAESGYRGAGYSSLRFFPALPVITHLLHDVTRLPTGAVLLAIAAVCSLAATMVVYSLTVFELGDQALGSRAAWLFSLVPSAYVLTMGYSEAPFILACAGCLFCLRRQRWIWAAALGYLAGLTRPLGVLLALAATVEVLRESGLVAALGPSRPPSGDLARRSLAVAGPVAGTVTYLGWVAASYHDFFAPVTIQLNGRRHGSVTDPLAVLVHSASQVVHTHDLVVAGELAAVVLSVAMAAVALYKLPLSYGVFSAAVVVVSISGHSLDSYARYAWSAFPLVMAGAALLRSERVAVPVLVASGVGLLGLAMLSFQGVYVP